MRGSGLLLFVFFATLSSTLAQCSLYELECCLSQFSSIVRPSGIDLSEQRVAAACTVEEETLECLDTFLDQCFRNETDTEDVENIANKTKLFITEICPPSSEFMTKLKANEVCILNSSSSFTDCYNKNLLPQSTGSDEERLKKDCCEYKELRNCAVQTVENKCGATASQLVHEEVVHMNGAVLEWVCNDIFTKCESSAMMLVSSALFVLYSVAILYFLLY